jgi:hypothetical protein
MADRVTVVPPRDPWPFSTVTADDLEALVADGLLRPLSGDPKPEWMVPPSGACDTPGVSFALCREIYPNFGCSAKISISLSHLSPFIKLLMNVSPNLELFDLKNSQIWSLLKLLFLETNAN